MEHGQDMNINYEKRDEMIGILCELSDKQFEPCAKERLKAIVGRTDNEAKDELLGLIDDCVFCAWCSNFEIKIMNILWEMSGGTPEELAERNRLLQEASVPVLKEFEQRFKWKR